jgi:hypothetical protein
MFGSVFQKVVLCGMGSGWHLEIGAAFGRNLILAFSNGFP